MDLLAERLTRLRHIQLVLESLTLRLSRFATMLAI